MAYLAKEVVAEIRKELRKKFPTKQGYGFSVTNNGGRGVIVRVTKAPLQLTFGYHYYLADVNMIKSLPQKFQDFFNGIRAVIFGLAGDNVTTFNYGDDYASSNYNFEIRVGDYNKPFVCTKPITDFSVEFPSLRNMDENERVMVDYDGNRFQFSRWDYNDVTVFYGNLQRRINIYSDDDEIKTVLYQMWLSNQ